MKRTAEAIELAEIKRRLVALEERLLAAAVTTGTVVAAPYVTIAASGDLPAERVLTAGTGIDITDGGAGGAATVAIESTVVRVGGQLGGTGAAPTVVGITDANESTFGIDGALDDESILAISGGSIATAMQIDDVVRIAGQIGGTGASPDVRGVRTTTGPTLLAIGAIADGETVKRSGASLVGYTPAGASPAGASTEVQYRDAGAFGAAARLLVDAAGNPLLVDGAAAATPAAGRTGLYTRTLAGRSLPWIVDADGFHSPMQPGLFWGGMAGGCFFGSSTIGDGIFGHYGSLANYGTGSVPAIAATSILAATPRRRWTSVAAVNSAAGHTGGIALWFRSGTVRLGGFLFHTRFAPLTDVTGARMFVGLSPTGNACTAADPTTFNNIVGIGYEEADAAGGSLYTITTDAAGATKTAIAASARGTAELYDLWLWCFPGDSTTVYASLYDVTNDTWLLDSQTLTATLPATGTVMKPTVQMSTGTITTAQIIDIARVYTQAGV